MRTRLLFAATLTFALAAPASAQLPPESPTGRGIGGSSTGLPDRRVNQRAEPAKPSDVAPSVATPGAAAPQRNGNNTTPDERSNAGVATGSKGRIEGSEPADTGRTNAGPAGGAMGGAPSVR